MKKSLFWLLILLCGTFVFAFDWPQTIETTSDFKYFFAQEKQGAFSSSLVFAKSSEVFASDKGDVLFKINSGIADMGWFESTLGNAVIVSHENSMLTVYGDLKTVYVDDEITTVTKETAIGSSDALEFQVIDTKAKTFINPLILMPVIESKKSLPKIDLYAINVNDEKTSIVNNSKIQSGTYKFYLSLPESEVLYKTSISINGSIAETIVFDTLSQQNNVLCINDNANYDFEKLYPKKGSELLGEVSLAKGKNTIAVRVEDFFGNSRVATYSITVE